MKPYFLQLFSVLLCVNAASAEQVKAVDRYHAVDLDAYIESQRPLRENTRTIIQPRAIRIQARLLSKPERRHIEYAYTALSAMRVYPLPVINHRMFIRSSGGRAIPVYVTADAAEKIGSGLQIGEQAQFSGYHIYNYRQGPAIVVEDFARP